MNLTTLTGHDCGIICYGENKVANLNWSSFEDNQFPIYSPACDNMFAQTENEGWADGVIEERTDDFRKVLPGSVWLNEKKEGTMVLCKAECGTVYTDLDILYDPFSDIMLAFIGHPFLPQDINNAATVFHLADGRVIIVPDAWT